MIYAFKAAEKAVLRASECKKIFVLRPKKVFSHATDAKDFGIKGLWGYGVMGFISGRATSPFVASLNFEISKIH